MFDTALHVLLVEDNPDHATLIQRRMARLPAPPDVTHATSFSAAIEAIKKNHFDLMLLDLRLPDSDLDETFPRMNAAVPDLPIIVLTSLEEFDFAVGLVQSGAQDFLVKSDINAEALARSMHYAVERARIQRDLRLYAAELERTNRELDQFTRVVSHDLKSPLAVIQMDLNAAEDAGTLDAEAGRHVGNALKVAGQMARLIDNLLRYARLGGGQQIEFEQVDCDALVDEVLGEMETAIEAADGQVTRDPLPKIAGNPTLLSQLFKNLLTNALKYHGERPPEVHVSAEFHGPDWVFSVEDHGMGFPPDERERVFEMFTRLANDVPGTGVGLAICKRVVEAHGGRIWADSLPDRGTTFYFSLSTRPPAQGNASS